MPREKNGVRGWFRVYVGFIGFRVYRVYGGLGFRGICRDTPMLVVSIDKEALGLKQQDNCKSSTL